MFAYCSACVVPVDVVVVVVVVLVVVVVVVIRLCCRFHHHRPCRSSCQDLLFFGCCFIF